ncbi:hypothetical protein OG301_26645 [Streptomyces platensis]|uniref:hypothetical protein n=1 Tax=Streptomyces platensis TaxID=58346 RepID=UPI002ED52FFE|nr:hypothetical protein OG301_26645 [Streptomyces platensis]
MIRVIRSDYAPALGDLRVMGLGDVIVIQPGAAQRKDWSRYQDAIGGAVSRGAEVHQTAQDGGN